MNSKLYLLAVVIVLLIIIARRAQEHLEDSDDCSFIRLYETFTFNSNPPDTRSWEYKSSGAAWLKHDIRMNLKSYDISVKKGSIQIWAIYPDTVTASTQALGVAGFGNSYNDSMPQDSAETIVGYNHKSPVYLTQPGWAQSDSTNSYKANYSKYRKIAHVRTGEHIKGTLDFSAKRIMVIVEVE